MYVCVYWYQMYISSMRNHVLVWGFDIKICQQNYSVTLRLSWISWIPWLHLAMSCSWRPQDSGMLIHPPEKSAISPMEADHRYWKWPWKLGTFSGRRRWYLSILQLSFSAWHFLVSGYYLWRRCFLREAGALGDDKKKRVDAPKTSTSLTISSRFFKDLSNQL